MMGDLIINMISKEDYVKCLKENYNPKHKCDICGKTSRYSTLWKKLPDLLCNCNVTNTDLSFLKRYINP